MAGTNRSEFAVERDLGNDKWGGGFRFDENVAGAMVDGSYSLTDGFDHFLSDLFAVQAGDLDLADADEPDGPIGPDSHALVEACVPQTPLGDLDADRLARPDRR